MPRQFSDGLRLTFIIIWLGCPTLGWSVDKSALPPPLEISQVGGSGVPSPSTSSYVTPASFHTASNGRDEVTDDCEVASPPCLGRCLCQTPRNVHRCVRRKADCTKWWFSYISGHGPAVWDRD